MKLVHYVLDKCPVKPFLLILCGGLIKYDGMNTLNIFGDDLVCLQGKTCHEKLERVMPPIKVKKRLRSEEIEKEADQIWFGVEGVKELCDEWVTTRGFNPENTFSMEGFETHFLEIITEIKERVWELFTDMKPSSYPLCYFLMIIWEFYASYIVRHNEQKYKMLISAQPCLEIILVRGVKAPCTTSEINEIYFSYDLDSIVQYKRLIFGILQSYPRLSRVIAKGLPPWANGVGQIKRRDISVQAKHWLGFVGNRLLPSRNDQDITVDKAIIVGCIMDKISINSGELITEMIKLSTIPPPQSIQSARSSTVTFAKVASMTLANNATLTRLVADIP
ncbi:hypothetical protein CQW23_03229 [Capsicum baccatum]|uniref:Putative plant transposon protein domain-containing protein n=1 Tax=Capsicum baccatum TaxID=33114 RepID=A0A2G2XB93_CAPBA|nr:hypothetical protein CQW23_03229 [Capsicum baccatum]